MDDVDLATHLLCMCPARWQTQYDLAKNTTPVSTRAVLENIENDADLENKSQNLNKPKGAEGKCKMDLNKYHIPKKACKGLVHWKLPEKQGEKHCVLCKKHGGSVKSHNTCDCRCFNKDGTPNKNRGGASRPRPRKKGPKGMNLMQLMRTKIKKPYANIHAKTVNATQVNWIAIATPMTVPEGASQIALGNHVYVRNVN